MGQEFFSKIIMPWNLPSGEDGLNIGPVRKELELTCAHRSHIAHGTSLNGMAGGCSDHKDDLLLFDGASALVD